MPVHYLRFAISFLFLLMAIMLFLRHEIAPNLVAQFRNSQLELGSWLALVLAGWHAARGYFDWMNWRERATPRRSPLQSDHVEGQPYEKNPDFDFIKLPDAKQD